MRILNRILILILGLFLFLFVAFYVLFNFFGESIVKERLAAAFGRPVQLEYLRVLTPFGLVCDHLSIEGIIKAKEMSVQFGFPDFSGKYINLESLSFSEPQLTVKKNKERKIEVGDDIQQNTQIQPQNIGAESVAPEKKRGHPVFSVKNFMVKNGQLKFTDLSGEKEFDVGLAAIELKLRDFTYPFEDKNIGFDILASLLKSDLPISGSLIEGHGWVNWPRRNMDGAMTVKEPNGKISLAAALQSKENQMMVEGRLHVQSFMEGSKKPDSQGGSFEDLVFEALASSGVEIAARFKFQTQMDDFQIGTISFTGNVGYKAPGEGVQEKNTAQDLKSIGKQFEDFGKKFYKENIEKAPEAPSVPAGNEVTK